MFGIGSTELLVILVVALIVLGPKSLASVSRSLGKVVGEFRRVSTDFQRTLNVEAAQEEARQAAEKRRQEAARKEQTAPDNQSAAGVNQQPVNPGQPISKLGETQQDGPTIAPDDTPIGRAIAKAKAEAAKSCSSQQKTDSHASENTSHPA